MQYDTTINRWHTSKNTARINASQSLPRVHVPRRLGLQPGQPEPDEVRAQRDVRRGSLSPRRAPSSSPRRKSGRQHRLPDGSDRAQLARLSSAGPGLRQPGRAADGRRPALRLRCRPRLRRLRHRHHVRRSVSAVVEDRRTLPAAGRPPPSRPRKVSSETNLGFDCDTLGHCPARRACPGWYINREPFLDVIRMHRASVNNINRTNVPARSTKPARTPGTKPWSTAKSSATATRRSPCWLPPAPSAS